MTEDPSEPAPDQAASTIVYYRCPNCGQLYFSDVDAALPDMCSRCNDMTTWEPLNAP